MLCDERHRTDIIEIHAVPVHIIDERAEDMLAHYADDSTVGDITDAASVIALSVHPKTGEIHLDSEQPRTMKDTTDRSVAGVRHTVTVSASLKMSQTFDTEMMDALWKLQAAYYSLIITYADGERELVTADEDTYSCAIDTEDGNTSVTFSIQNITGPKRLI